MTSLADLGRVLLRVTGARGESFSDVARRTKTIAGIDVPTDATDSMVLNLLSSSLTDVVAAAGYFVIDPVKAATTASLTLSGAQTVDGVALVAGDRVLVKNQTSAAQNGVYVVAAGAWTRASDFDDSSEVKRGSLVNVLQGASQRGTWTLVTADPITVGATSQLWRSFSIRDITRSDLQDPAGAALVSFDQTKTYPAGSLGSRLQKFVSPTDAPFNAVGDGVADDTTAMNAAIAAAVSRGVGLDLSGKAYLLQSGAVNFAHGGLHIAGRKAALKFSGAGRAFVLDQGGANGEFLEGMCVEDIVIIGNSQTTDGFYKRGVVRSAFRNIEVRNVGGNAFNIKHGVSSHYDNLKYSAHPSDTAFAAKGIYLDNNGTGYYTANCTFTNPVMENFPGTGCELADAQGNVFLGGTFEACKDGIVTSAATIDNKWIKPWLEGNTNSDAQIAGSNNGFIGARMPSASALLNVQILAGAKGTWFAHGGYLRAIYMAAGSTGTSFDRVGVDENLGGTIGFQGPGPYTRIGCKKIDGSAHVVGVYPDIIGGLDAIGESGTWSPTLVAGSGSFVTNVSGLTQGTYLKIGKLVYVQCFIYVDSVSAPEGALSVAGLPFASASVRQAGSISATQLQSTATSALQVRLPNGGTLEITKLSAGQATNMAADIKADSTLTISIVYEAA